MPVLPEGQEESPRRRRRWIPVLLLALLLPLGLPVVPFYRPVDFRLGSTSYRVFAAAVFGSEMGVPSGYYPYWVLPGSDSRPASATHVHAWLLNLRPLGQWWFRVGVKRDPNPRP